MTRRVGAVPEQPPGPRPLRRWLALAVTIGALGVTHAAQQQALATNEEFLLDTTLARPDLWQLTTNNIGSVVHDGGFSWGDAAKTSVRGGVQVRVRRLAAASPRVRLRFEVEDSGAGIAVADQERLFQPFTQFGTGPERKRGGTGLGLAISRRLVELLGGRIGVRSEVGVGSVFWFELETEAEALADRAVKPPDTVPGSRPGVRPRALAAPGGATARPLRILVAEDHAVNRRLATLMLEKLGYHPGLVTNGREAVEAWERGGYDLILMDCQMPEMDGFEATREIRRRAAARPPGKPPGVKIIALTANALAGDRERCLAAGMDGYISKPVRLEQLGAALGAAALPGVSAPEPTGPPGEEKAMKAP